jgi:hypothetical protein
MTDWRTHFPCVIVNAESGIFKILMRQEDLLGRGKVQPGFPKAKG